MDKKRGWDVILLEYKFLCGCIDKEHKDYKCKEHKKRITDLKKECADCHKIFWTKYVAKNQSRCNECLASKTVTVNGKQRKKPLTPIIKYEMTCGCIIDNPVNTHNGLACPAHKKNRIKFVYKKCFDCSNIIKLLPKQALRIYCFTCSEKRKRNITKMFNREHRKTKNEVPNDPDFNVDKFFEDKFKKYFEDLNKDVTRQVLKSIKLRAE